MNIEQLPLPEYGPLIKGDFNQEAILGLINITVLNKSQQILISGSKGVGKTHTIQYCLKQILLDSPELIIVYKTAHQFTNEYIDSLRDQSTKEFRLKILNADIFILEDLEYLEDKERTPIELSLLLNELSIQQKTIILSVNCKKNKSTKLPKFITHLTTSFSMIKIGKPSSEARKLAVSELIKDINISDQENIIYFLANYCGTQIFHFKKIVNTFKLLTSNKPSLLTIEWLDQHREFNHHDL